MSIKYDTARIEPDRYMVVADTLKADNCRKNRADLPRCTRGRYL